MSSISPFFEPVKKDHKSGSSRILDQVIWATGKTIEELNWDQKATGILFSELKMVESAHPDLIILRHFISGFNRLLEDQGTGLTKELTLSWIGDYKAKWKNVNKDIARKFLEIQPVDGMNLLFHSHSGTLLELGREIFKRKTVANIFQTESNPGGEGRIQAIELENIGLEVNLIRDDEIPERLKHINLILFGADQISPFTWSNKVGTLMISKLAMEMKIPVWILSDSRKKVKKIKISNSIFEETGLEYITGLITENVEL